MSKDFTTDNVYVLNPIDNFEYMGWKAWTEGEDAALDAQVERAMRHIRASRWFEEPARDGIRWVMPLPTVEYEGDIYHAVAFKIENNGTTFVWSPVPLPWLDYESFRLTGVRPS